MRTLQFLVVAPLVAFNIPSTGAAAAPIVGAFQINSGSGYLNSGSGFRPVTVTTEVAAGDSVMVAPGGSAEIVYDKYCRIPVKPGRVAVVAPVSPCARGADLGPPAAPFPVKAAPPAESQDNTGYYLLGGAAAVGLGVGIWALTKSSSSSPAPASP
jgi:hypothetical protein